MNRLLATADRFLLGGGSYVSPRTTVTEISNEGVLCISSPDNEGWTEETPNW